MAITVQHSRARAPLVLCYLAFVSLGLPDGLTGVAWPAVRETFGLPLDALGPLLIAVTAGYVTSSVANGWLRRHLQLGALLALSCVATATSLLGYAIAPVWGLMVAAGSLAGLGAGAIDAGLNAYVATHHSPRTLNLLHAFYGLGTTTGPLLMTGVLLSGHSWRYGYAMVSLAQIALAVGFAASLRLWPPADPATGLAHRNDPVSHRATLGLPAVQLGIAAFFFYTGIEATCGAWLYSLLREARGAPMATAGSAVSIYWGSLMLSRVAFGLLADRWPLGLTVRRAVQTLFLGAAVLALDIGPMVDLAAIVVLGAACGPIFPLLMAGTPRRLDIAHSAHAVGYQVAAATLGASILPALVGVAAQGTALEAVPVALLTLTLVLGVACRGLSGS